MNNNLKSYIAQNFYYNKVKESVVTDFPFAMDAGLTMSTQTNIAQFEIGKELQEKLNKMSRNNAPNEFVILQSVCVALLYKYGVNNATILSPGMCGKTTDSKEGTGIFATVVKMDDSFGIIVDNLKQQFRDTIKHELHDLSSLVEQLRVNGYKEHVELFNILFGFDRVCSTPLASQIKFKIYFFVSTEHDVYRLKIHYNSSVYTSEYVDLLGNYFVFILEKLLTNINNKLDSIKLDDPQIALMEQFNNTIVPRSTNKTVIDLLADSCSKYSRKTALRFRSSSIDFETLDKRINCVSASLGSYGITRGDIVAVMLDRSDWLVPVIFGILKSGAAYLPIDPDYPTDRTTHMIEDSQCKIIITNSEVSSATLKANCRPVCVEEFKSGKQPSETTDVQCSESDLAYVIYTSGSTGKPKGVKIHHDSLLNFVLSMNEVLEPAEDDHILAVTSISFDISLLEIIWTLCNGISVTLKDDSLSVSNFNRFCEAEEKNEMDFSLFYFSSGGSSSEDKYQLLFDSARFADENGFSALWTPERHFHDFGGIYPNPAITSAALAVRTNNISIRSGSIVLPIHDVVRVAEDWAVIDNLSKGRIGLSIASGWHADDFVFFPQHFECRYDTMYHQINELKELWNGNRVKRKNGLGREVEITVYPQPIQKELPIWITAAGNIETFESAGKIGANILTHLLGQDIEDLSLKIKAYKKALTENGHSVTKAKISLMLHTYVGEDLAQVEKTVREPFKSYLRSSLGLLSNLAKSLGVSLKDVNEEVVEELIEEAFKRYWKSASLIGTPETCETMLSRLRTIGVNEIACLVDFGIPYQKVMEGLPLLDKVKRIFTSEERIVRKEKISLLQTTPSLLKLAIDDDSSHQFLRSLKKIFIGGEKLPSRLVKSLRKVSDAIIYNLYGPTETTIWSTAGVINDEEIHVGRPIANTHIYILDQNGYEAPIGAFGQVFIGGSGLSKGYVNNDSLTKEKFATNSILPGTPVLYDTGDIGRWTVGGKIEIRGRVDNQIKLHGRRIELGEIEETLNQCPGIKGSAVILDEINKQGELIAFCLLADKIKFDDLRNHLKSKLPTYMIPSRFFSIEALPLTPNGKTDKKKLKNVPALPLDGCGEYKAAETQVQSLLVSVWENVLQRSGIGISDNFFMLGGDSIKAVQIASSVYKLGYKLMVKDVFQYPSIENLSAQVKELDKTENQSPVVGDVELTPIQIDFFENATQERHHHNQSTIIRSSRPLQFHMVKSIIEHLQLHHDMLRTTFTVNNGSISQTINGTDFPISLVEYDLKEEDHNSLLMNSRIYELQQSIDLENGPLLKAAIFHLRDGERLLLVIHHLVIDGISWRILLEDMQALLRQALNHEKLNIPLKTASFQNWSKRLLSYAQSNTFQSEISFWEKLVARGIPKLKRDFHYEEAILSDMTSISFSLDDLQTNLLLTQTSKIYKTEINDILIAALSISLKSLNDGDQIVIAMEGHGREELFNDISITRTIGWFTSIYPVWIDVDRSYDLPYHIRKTKETLHRVPNKGIGYGILKHMAGVEIRKRVSLDTQPDILFNYLGQFNDHKENTEFSIANESSQYDISDQRRLQNIIDVSGMIYSGRLTLSISYSKKQFAPETIQTVIDSFKNSLIQIIDHCCNTKIPVPTPSDFTYKDLSLDQLDAIMHEVTGEIQDIYPLSPVQEGILFHMLHENSAAYHHQLTYRIHGSIDVALVRSTLEILVRQYSILRTIFIFENTVKPLQIVLKAKDINFSFVDVSNIQTENEKENALSLLRENDLKKSFDLRIDTLLRVTVVKLNSNQYEIIQSHHHIIMDGWSANLFNKHFYSIYGALLDQQQPIVSPTEQYSFFIKWLLAQNRNDAKQYWRNYLVEVENVTVLPSLCPSVGSYPYKLAEDRLTIGRDRTAKLNELASSNNVTLNIVVTALWGILLCKYNNCKDAVFGSVVSGRPPELTDVEEMLGLFINTIPVRVKFSSDTSFLQLLGALQRDSVNALNYHYSSLAEIQVDSNLKKDLINHILIFENFPISQSLRPAATELNANFKQEVIDVTEINEYLQTNYDFNLVVIPAEQLTFKFSYNESKYSSDTIENIKGHLSNVIDQICLSSNILIDKIDIITAPERKKILTEYNSSIALDKFLECDFFTLFEKVSLNNPDAIALRNGEEFITYGELLEKTNTLAAALVHQCGVRKGDFVGIIQTRSSLTVIGILSILRAGASFVPIDPSFPEDRKKHIVKDCGCSLLLTKSKSKSATAEGVFNFILDDFDFTKQDFPKLSGEGVSEIAYILYTSGSSGTPKGVEVYSKGLMNYLSWANMFYFKNTVGFNLPLFTPITFDLTITSLFTPLLRGDSLFIYDDDAEITEILVDIFRDNKNLKAVKLTPSHVDALMLLPVQSTSIDLVIIGGEPLGVGHVQFLRSLNKKIRIFNEYGPTETTVGCTVEEVLESPSLISVGFPIANSQIYILDSNSNLSPPGVIGELCIAGAGVARGYHNEPTLTAEKFVENPFGNPNSPVMYKSGDHARWLSDGRIDYIGRKDDQLKIRGHRIETGEITRILLAYPGMVEALILVRRLTKGIGTLVCYFHSDVNIDVVDLRKYAAAKLPDYMVPTFFVYLESFPLTENGKLDRNKLPDPATKGSRVQSLTPLTSLERKLVEIWGDVLETREIGLEDSFFDLGGHSLKVIQITSRIHHDLNVVLKLKDVFEYPTIAEQARYISTLSTDNQVKISALKTSDYYDLSHPQKRLWVESQFNEKKGSFNIAGGFKLRGALNETAFEKAFETLIDRHEILRTLITSVDGVPKQKVISVKLFPFKFIKEDFRSHPDPQSQVGAYALREAFAPFDLEHGPLLRVSLIKTDSDSYVFIIVLHHIISDAWSNVVLIDEISKLYEAYCKGMENPLQPLRIQYKDYAHWHNLQLKSKASEKHRQYWTSKFAGHLFSEIMPLDFPRSKAISSIAGHVTIALDMDTTMLLRQLSTKNGHTLYFTLLASVNVLFYRYSNKSNIVIGSPVSGRIHKDLEDQVGFYINTLPLKTTIEGALTFNEFLRKVYQETLEAFEHQIYPLDLLVEDINLTREANRNPLIDIGFTWNKPWKNSEADLGLNIEPFALEARTVKSDLWIYGQEHEDSIHFDIEYNPTIFKLETIQLLGERLSQLLSQIAVHPDLKLNNIDLSQRNLVLEDVKSDSESFDMNLSN